MSKVLAPWPGHLGIAGRLAIAFVAVAVLAVAASLVGQFRVSTVRTASVQPVLPAPPAAGAKQERLKSGPESSVVIGEKSLSADQAGVRNATTAIHVSGGSRAAIGLVAMAMAMAIIVLLLLVAICIGTIRSILEPIHQLIATADRLADGDRHAHVVPSGVRELDALAAAFNRMTQTLHTAHSLTRDREVKLEACVDERTRQLEHLAGHDPLTGLPNRHQLLTYLHSALRAAHRNGTHLGVLFLDLDNFKNINDSMGHAFGDLVLIAVAERLRNATAAGGFAARPGGDELTVVYERADSVEEIYRFGEDLVSAFQKPLIVAGKDLLIGVSIGASVHPDHGHDAEALLRAADAALFQVKTTGRNRLCIFRHELLANASLKFRIEQGLRHATERGEFELLFQPVVSFDTLGTKVVEALLRWRLPDGSHVAPSEFLTVAEETGLIVPLGDWVLTSAIEAAARWHHGSWPDVRVAINISARQLTDTGFVDRIWHMLREHKLPPRCIEIELTENVWQTGPATIETLHGLRELGISITLDDFGAGYSSLSSLEQLPLTRVKLDRSLIANIDKTPRALAIARAVIGLCRSLGLEVTAEGVERPEQLVLLVDHPSLCLQGYLIAMPATAQRLPQVVAQMPQHLQSLLLSAPPVPESVAFYASPGTSETHAALEPEPDLPIVRDAVEGA